MTFNSLEDAFILGRWSYLMGEPLLSDVEYDKIEKEYKEKHPDSPYSKRPWSFDECPKELLTQYNLTSLIAELEMGYAAESIASINSWSLLQQNFLSLNTKSRLSFKVDGWNTRASYYNGNLISVKTRGRSGNNLNIEQVRELFPKSIPVKGRCFVTGELSIPNDIWASFKLYTGNKDQRASVRTAIANGMVNFLCFRAFNFFAEDAPSDLSTDPYSTLTEWGFTTPTFMFVSNYDELKAGIKRMSLLDKYNDVLTDGLVIENDAVQLAIRLGQWEEHSMHSIVTGYVEKPGMWGRAINVTIEPYESEGKTFTEVSMVNLASVIENNLRIGYPIAFNLRSSANVVIDTVETRRLQEEKFNINLNS